MSDQSERSLVQIQAMVMVYDNGQKEWMFAGVSDGNSKVQIFHHPINNTFRVVARKLFDHEIVINCAILKSTKYNRATETFHQWRDRQNVYGLSFMCPDDANTFGQSMENVLLSLNTATPAPQLPTQQLFSKPTNDNNNDNGDDNRSLYSRAQPAQGAGTLHKPSGPPPMRPPSQVPPTAPPLVKAPTPASTIPVAPPSGPPVAAVSGTPMAPPACPPAAGGAPPPPPPPPPPSGAPAPPASAPSNASEDSGNPMSDLASAIAGAKLKKMNKPTENGPSPMGSSSSLGPSAAVQSSKPPAMDMMSEMAKKLQSRKAKAEGSDAESSSAPSVTATSVPVFQKSKVAPPWKASTSNQDNPQANILPAPTTRDSTPSPCNPPTNSELELFKQQIISEMKVEMMTMMNKFKEDIVEILRSELSKR